MPCELIEVLLLEVLNHRVVTSGVSRKNRSTAAWRMILKAKVKANHPGERKLCCAIRRHGGHLQLGGVVGVEGRESDSERLRKRNCQGSVSDLCGWQKSEKVQA